MTDIAEPPEDDPGYGGRYGLQRRPVSAGAAQGSPDSGEDDPGYGGRYGLQRRRPKPQPRADAYAGAIPHEATPEMIIAGELAGMKYMDDAKAGALVRDVRPTVTAEIYRAMVKCALAMPS